MRNWTKEPWASRLAGFGRIRIQGVEPHKPGCYSKENAQADADRIVSCVNALAGVPDPAAFVAAVRAAVEAGSIDELHLTIIREAMGIGPAKISGSSQVTGRDGR